MQVVLNTKVSPDLRVRVDAQVAKEKRRNPERSLAQIVAEALEMYLAKAAE